MPDSSGSRSGGKRLAPSDSRRPRSSGKRRRRSRAPASLPAPIVLIAAILAVLWFVLPRGNESTAQSPAVTPAESAASASQTPAPTGSADAGDTSPAVSPAVSAPAESAATSETSGDVPWNLVLVNAKNPLPDGFTVQTSSISNGKEFDSRAVDALNDMLDACRAAGLDPLVCSAYRSVERQTELFNNKIKKLMADGMTHDEAYASAATVIAIPGTSEHNLGLAADICANSYQILDDTQADTDEQKWLMAHCSEYGFILRYPKDKEDVTGIIYEPWHYRYVGVDAAKEITEKGLCLEEYYQQHYGS